MAPSQIAIVFLATVLTACCSADEVRSVPLSGRSREIQQKVSENDCGAVVRLIVDGYMEAKKTSPTFILDPVAQDLAGPSSARIIDCQYAVIQKTERGPLLLVVLRERAAADHDSSAIFALDASGSYVTSLYSYADEPIKSLASISSEDGNVLRITREKAGPQNYKLSLTDTPFGKLTGIVLTPVP